MTTEWLEVCLLALVLAVVAVALLAEKRATDRACRRWPRMAAMLGRRPERPRGGRTDGQGGARGG